MYRAFNLTGVKWEDYTNDSAVALTKSNSEIAQSALEQFIRDGKIDGSKMQDHWFPKIKADVFISHSRNDQSAAIKLAGFLKSVFALDSFIDSCVWGHANDLIRQIDRELSWEDEKRQSYSYEKRNASNSHVHMMLSTALGAMLDTAECAVFIKTPNSITTEESITATFSPWIYYEIGLMRIIKPRTPERLMLESFANKEASAKFKYKLDLSHLTELNSDSLNRWQKEWPTARKRGVNVLDLLYDIAP